MSTKQRLELNWIGKDHRPHVEPRILIEDPERSCHASRRATDGDVFDNMLIFGDNLLGLKALEKEFIGLVKCIYIDPPFNIGAASDYYDDGLEHSEWLSLMRPRLELLRTLLSSDGLIFIHIDDEEMPYLCVMADEIFGRSNRVNIIAVKMSEATGVKMSHATKRFPKTKEFILVYRKDMMPELSPIQIPLDVWNDEYKEIFLNIERSDLDKIKALMEEDEQDASTIDICNRLLANARILSLSAYYREHNTPENERNRFRWNNAWRIIQAVGAGSIKERAKAARVTGQDVSAVRSARGKLYLFKTEFDPSARDPRIRIIFADKYLQYNPGDFWTDIKDDGWSWSGRRGTFPKRKEARSPYSKDYSDLHTTRRLGT